MFYKQVESKQDAIEYLQSGKNASEILERLEQLAIITGHKEPTSDPIAF
jgi:hypothetical protein